MKKIIFYSLVSLFFSTQAAQAAQTQGSVNYACQSGKSVKVTYRFNEVGLPTSAKAYINGRMRHMPINLSLSNNTGTTFGEEGEYVLAASYLDNKNFRQSHMLLTSPNNRILFKNCSATRKAPRPAKQHVAKTSVGKVRYACQGGKSLKVTYRFNEVGLPTSAKAYINGRTRHMPINLSRSDNTGTTFGKDGQYVLAASYLDNTNFKKSHMLLTSPSNKILFKNCQAR